VLINQWANVVRWELRPRLLLRTSEFLWQEGHTAHTSREEAHQYALGILDDVYAAAMVEELATPVFSGRKTEREKFAGAEISWSCEGVMRDGKALQMGTSHELGQNFANSFGTKFTDQEGQLRHVWQTSWGASTRLLGAMIMVHRDDHGLRVPPQLAPIQVVVLVARAGEGVAETVRTLADDLHAQGVRTEVDERADVTLGRRIVDHELRGVPLRIELGPRDLATGRAIVARRARGAKTPLPLHGLAQEVPRMLREDQAELLAQASALRDRLTRRADSIDETITAAEDGLARVLRRDVGTEGEQRLLRSGICVRCLLREDGRPVDDPNDESVDAVVGRAY
jgi:prolyl-tRNA synthetase